VAVLTRGKGDRSRQLSFLAAARSENQHPPYYCPGVLN